MRQEDPNFPCYATESFPLTYEGLLQNQAYFEQQKYAGNPNYKYAGNCTKWFADAVVEKHGLKEWERIQSIPLPSAEEFEVKKEVLENEVRKLVQNDNSWKTRSRLIRKFHQATFNASNRKGQLSPNDFWKLIQLDYTTFKQFYHNRLRCSDWFKENSKKSKWLDPIFPNHMHFLPEGFVPDFIWSIGVDTSRKAPVVSFFKPALAKHLVKTYLKEFDEIYDPFAGLSGRVLGTLAAGKKYIGCDINKQIISESKELLAFAEPILKEQGLSPEWKLTEADAITTKAKAQAVMTCSPYGMSEQWNKVGQWDKSCDQWIDVVVQNIEAQRYVFVTDGDIVKYKLFVKETLENFSHFGTNSELVVVFDRKEVI